MEHEVTVRLLPGKIEGLLGRMQIDWRKEGIWSRKGRVYWTVAGPG